LSAYNGDAKATYHNVGRSPLPAKKRKVSGKTNEVAPLVTIVDGFEKSSNDLRNISEVSYNENKSELILVG